MSYSTFAGTIIEDKGEVIAAFGAALKNKGICISDCELEEWKGASKREVIRHLVERQEGRNSPTGNAVEETYKVFQAELESLYRRDINPTQGATSTFDWCRERGIQLATTTGFYSEIRDLIWIAWVGAACSQRTFAAAT